MKEQLKGIVLVLFGILLCCAEKGLNSTVFARFSDFPFSLLGVFVGIAGLIVAFGKMGEK